MALEMRARMSEAVDELFLPPRAHADRIPKDTVISEVFAACALPPRTKTARKNEKELAAVLESKGYKSGPSTRVDGKSTAVFLMRRNDHA